MDGQGGGIFLAHVGIDRLRKMGEDRPDELFGIPLASLIWSGLSGEMPPAIGRAAVWV